VAQVLLYAAELDVVRHRHLWPRSLQSPMHTEADGRVSYDLAEQEPSPITTLPPVRFVAPTMTGIRSGAVDRSRKGHREGLVVWTALTRSPASLRSSGTPTFRQSPPGRSSASAT
jgi:hypothetical protein